MFCQIEKTRVKYALNSINKIKVCAIIYAVKSVSVVRNI